MIYILNGDYSENKGIYIDIDNRALNYGDGVFETVKYANGQINFWEDHYFRLMANMRIVRMEIPMSFSPEFLEEQFRKVIEVNKLKSQVVRLKLLVWRKSGGYYTPEDNKVEYLIMASVLPSALYELNKRGWQVDLFEDYYKQKSLLSAVKTTSSILYTVAGVFKKENQLDEVILINNNKSVVEGISHNIFLARGNEVITPPLESSCLRGIMRKKVIEILPEIGYTIIEKDFSPFEFQKADEMFFTNSINGIRWVFKYRKREFYSECSQKLIEGINAKVTSG